MITAFGIKGLEVAILYSSSQNSLVREILAAAGEGDEISRNPLFIKSEFSQELVTKLTAAGIPCEESQSFIHQVRILSYSTMSR